MAAVATAILCAVFIWWFATGVVLLLVLRRPLIRATLVGAAVLFPLSLYLLAKTSDQTTLFGAYVAFAAAILLWGTQEIGFLTGFLTGPRPKPCPPAARGIERLRLALAAILYHEIALIGSGVAVLVVTWGGPNQIGTLTFAVLWVMRVSAKLNLYLGVPVLNDAYLPEPIAFVRSFFRRDTVNDFFPLSLLLSVLATCGFVGAAAHPDASSAAQAGYTLVATLMGLAILEHLFMLVPLPVDKLWRWSTRWRSGPKASLELRHGAIGDLERVAPTRS